MHLISSPIVSLTQMIFRSFIAACAVGIAAAKGEIESKKPKTSPVVSLGPRPYYLIDTMESSFLKTKFGEFGAISSIMFCVG